MYKRGTEIRKMIGEGYNVETIKYELSRQFNVSESAIEQQYYNLLKEICAVVTDDQEILRSKLMLRNELIYERALTNRNFKAALEANMAQAKLSGMLEKETAKSKLPEIIEISQKPPLRLASGEDESD